MQIYSVQSFTRIKFPGAMHKVAFVPKKSVLTKNTKEGPLETESNYSQLANTKAISSKQNTSLSPLFLWLQLFPETQR